VFKRLRWILEGGLYDMWSSYLDSLSVQRIKHNYGKSTFAPQELATNISLVFLLLVTFLAVAVATILAESTPNAYAWLTRCAAVAWGVRSLRKIVKVKIVCLRDNGKIIKIAVSNMEVE
jgi:hypothetical protein